MSLAQQGVLVFPGLRLLALVIAALVLPAIRQGGRWNDRVPISLPKAGRVLKGASPRQTTTRAAIPSISIP
jgi:hypothetical protein